MILESLCECRGGCGFLSSKTPSLERCDNCETESEDFGEFCDDCGGDEFSPICPFCSGDCVVDHPDTIGPRRPLYCEEVKP